MCPSHSVGIVLMPKITWCHFLYGVLQKMMLRDCVRVLGFCVFVCLFLVLKKGIIISEHEMKCPAFEQLYTTRYCRLHKPTCSA